MCFFMIVYSKNFKYIINIKQVIYENTITLNMIFVCFMYSIYFYKYINVNFEKL